MSNKINPEKQANSIRFGWLLAGDGNEYQIARAGFGPRGLKMATLMEEISNLVKQGGGNAANTFEKINELFTLALSPFYNESTIQNLIENDQFGWNEYAQMLNIILGDDLAGEKKSS